RYSTPVLNHARNMLKAAYMLLLLSGNGVSLIWKAIMIRSNLRPYIFYTWLKNHQTVTFPQYFEGHGNLITVRNGTVTRSDW
ncbi:unnamed protein product, partial [Brassica oleracea]